MQSSFSSVGLTHINFIMTHMWIILSTFFPILQMCLEHAPQTLTNWGITWCIKFEFSSQKCLRNYVPGHFIVSSTKLNFLILLIKSIFWLNKIVSVDQVFFTIFPGKVSKTWFWYSFLTFYDFSNNPSPTFFWNFTDKLPLGGKCVVGEHMTSNNVRTL